jgi:hypothetical protein
MASTAERRAAAAASDSPTERLLAAETGEVHLRLMRGNAGDALIHVATLALLARLGLPARHIVDDAALDPAGKTIVVVGGGNLVPGYREAAGFLERVHARARRVLVLPSTIRGNQALLGALGPNVHLVCREAVSYAHVGRFATRAGCHLDHDLALSLDARALLAQPPPPFPWRALAAAGWRARARAVAAEVAARGLPRREVLRCFRLDGERAGPPPPPGNRDLPALLEPPAGDPAATRWSAHRLLAILDRAAVVHTDRLHVAIGAALLGKRVRLHPGCYDKNRSVYEHSLRARFPSVSFHA